MANRAATFQKKAAQDIAEAAFWHKREANEGLAERFIDQTQKAVQRAVDFPGIGSLRFARILVPPHVRCTPVETFPYLVFYVGITTGIQVVRVLHNARDVPTHLQETPGE